ncbi:MAG: uncharacterized protein KVP18_004340 [Porospora cf. gigantea A]|nr:MAG: hypothetical protein KVP18_004340 [Porospora cf. gigantea A]
MDVDLMLEQLACSQHAEESLEFLYCCGESLVNANSYDLFVVFNRALTIGESLRRHVVGQRLGAAWERAACEVIVGYWTAENIRFEESLHWSRAVINALESVCGYIVPALHTAYIIREMNVNIDGLLSAVGTLLHGREQMDPAVASEAHHFRLAVQLLENLNHEGPLLQRVLEEEMDEENLLPDSFSGTFNWSVPPIETSFRCSTHTERTLYRWTMYTCMRMELLGPFFETLNMRRLFIAKTVGFGFPGVFKLEVARFLRNCSKRVLLDRKDFNRAALVVCFRCKDMGELDLTRIDFKRIFFGVVRSLPFGIGFQLMSECDVLINTPFFLVESPVYMKAMMSALEYMRNGDLLVRNPLYQTILQGNTGPSTTPRYLRGRLDVRDLYVEKQVPICWQPETGALPVAESELDMQGLAAFQAAMTREVVLLEGVPQMRKLAIVKLIEVLARNQRGLPVVLLSFTNFAVDKMLLMLQERVPTANIVRLGGNVSDRGMQFKVTKNVDRKGARAARASLEQAVRRVSDWLASKGTAHVESLMIVHVPTSQLFTLFEKGMGGRNYHPEIHNDLYSFVGMQLVFYLQAWLRGEKIHKGAKWNLAQLRRGAVPWSELRRSIRGAIEVVKRNVEEELAPFGYEPVEFPALNGRLADLTAYRRDAVVDCVLSQACARVNNMFLSSLRECDLKRVELEAVDQAAVCRAAKKATVVGMTATFASLNRSVIERLSPRVIIAEGATQCLEPLLVSCLTSPCLEHLILVGNSRKHLPSLRYVKLRNTLFQRSLTSRLVSAGHPCYSLGVTEPARPADCHVVYPCGHRCLQKARPMHSHEGCRHPCQRVLVCGHVCSNLCSEPCVSICEEPCSMGCPHGRCPNLCHEACASCHEPCPFQCLCPGRNPKKLCSHLCYNACGKKLCTARCHRTCVCGERCAAFCGDPCHPCFRCDVPGATCPLTKRKLAEKAPAEMVVHLSCGHSLFHDAFAAYVA